MTLAAAMPAWRLGAPAGRGHAVRGPSKEPVPGRASRPFGLNDLDFLGSRPEPGACGVRYAGCGRTARPPVLIRLTGLFTAALTRHLRVGSLVGSHAVPTR